MASREKNRIISNKFERLESIFSKYPDIDDITTVLSLFYAKVVSEFKDIREQWKLLDCFRMKKDQIELKKDFRIRVQHLVWVCTFARKMQVDSIENELFSIIQLKIPKHSGSYKEVHQADTFTKLKHLESIVQDILPSWNAIRETDNTISFVDFISKKIFVIKFHWEAPDDELGEWLTRAELEELLAKIQNQEEEQTNNQIDLLN